MRRCCPTVFSETLLNFRFANSRGWKGSQALPRQERPVPGRALAHRKTGQLVTTQAWTVSEVRW